MTKGRLIGLFLCTIVIAIGTGLIIWNEFRSVVFSGTTVSFLENQQNAVSPDNLLEIVSDTPVLAEASDSVYFRFYQDGVNHEGKSGIPPLDYPHGDYYQWEGRMAPGAWEILNGNSVSIIMKSEDSFEVKYYSTESSRSTTISTFSAVAFIFWLIIVFILCFIHF